MSGLDCESFGSYPLDNSDTTATNHLLDAAGYFVIPGAISTANARIVAQGPFSDDQCLRYDNGLGYTNSTFQTCEVVRPVQGDDGELIYGLRWYIEDDHNLLGSAPFMSIYDAEAGLRIATVSFANYGMVKAYSGRSTAGGGEAAGTLLGGSEPGAWRKGAWFYGEARVHANYFEVRINTDPVLIIPSIGVLPVGASEFNAIGWGAEGSFNSTDRLAQIRFRIKDLYVCDEAGDVNNTFLGNVRCINVPTDGPGGSTDLAIAGAQPTNWQAASNTARDATSYVFSANPGDKDSYSLSPILTNQPVHFVKTRSVLWMDEATQRVARNLFTIGATTHESADIYVDQLPADEYDIVELNPDTGLGMTGTDVNGAEVGILVEA